MQKPKIGIIGLKGLPAFGGAATVGENIIEQLKAEYDFTVYSTSSHTHLKTGELNGYKQIVFKKIPFKKLNTLYYYIISAFHAIFFSNYNLIHLHHRDAAFIILILKLRYKVILTTHSSFKLRDKWKSYKRYFELQEKYFVKLADQLTCVSKSEQKLFKEKVNINAIFIPNGINLVDAELPNIDYPSEYIFFGAGRIIRSKGCEILLKALQEINYKGEVLIAGDLDQTHDYKKEVLTLADSLNVRFLGLIKDKRLLLSYLKYSMLFIFPSNWEAMSMMLLEAASVKARIICSDIVENKDIFNEDEVLFFETDNHIDLGKKIKWAESNNVIMNDKANNAFEKLVENNNWKDIAEKYSNEYKKLL